MRKMFMAYLLLFSQVAWVAENATQQPTEDQGSEEAALDTGVTPEEAAALVSPTLPEPPSQADVVRVRRFFPQQRGG